MQNGVQLKISRQRADYDPDYVIADADAQESVKLAEDAIAALENTPQLYLITLAAHLLTPLSPRALRERRPPLAPDASFHFPISHHSPLP